MYAGVGTFILASILKTTMGLRVTLDGEETGLDISEHGEAGSAGSATGDEGVFPTWAIMHPG